MTAPTFEGALGRAWLLPLDFTQIEMPEQIATVAHYLVDIPSAHPLWPQYVLVCVHLRDVEGQTRPPIRRFATASHEVLLVALNVPDYGRFTPENIHETMKRGGALLSPCNIVEQLDGATDDQAHRLTDHIARALVDGVLPAEPSDYLGARERWRSAIAATLEHIRFGGHPVGGVH